MATATKVQAQASVLDNAISFQERQRLTILSVLRNGTGELLAKQARLDEEDFNWDEFKSEFNEEYGELSAKQLLALCKEFLGITNMEGVYKRYQHYQKQYRRRQKNAIA
jgi:hypothetical protein